MLPCVCVAHALLHSYYNVEIKDVTPDDMDAPPMSTVMGDGGALPPQSQVFALGSGCLFLSLSTVVLAKAPAAYAAPPLTRGSSAAANYPQARTLYAFVGQDATELSFSEGEFISVTAQQGEWWTGMLRGKVRKKKNRSLWLSADRPSLRRVCFRPTTSRCSEGFNEESVVQVTLFVPC